MDYVNFIEVCFRRYTVTPLIHSFEASSASVMNRHHYLPKAANFNDQTAFMCQNM
jgi:hypothetical protein